MSLANQADLDELFTALASKPITGGTEKSWPAESLELCANAGVFSWFIEKEQGGQAWTEAEITTGYLGLAAACLTTAFIITQRTAATKRISHCQNEALKSKLLPRLATGEISITVGISHLTTSRQHTDAAMKAEPIAGGFRVSGYSPWVTGGMHADYILMGAELPDQKQILFVASQSDVAPDEPQSLMALQGSCTGSVQVNDLIVTAEQIVGGPVEQVMKSAKGAMTGGLQTSTLAIGLATAAVDYLRQQASRRSELVPAASELGEQLAAIRSQLMAFARGESSGDKQVLRQTANSLVLRATQAALVAAKGAGYVEGHRVGRWCREAMFFLVWSCPQNVVEANLCELAGVDWDLET